MHKFLVTCSRGLETELLAELENLGLLKLEAVNGGVCFRGSFEQAMKVCLWSRQASKVMLSLIEGRVENEQDLYNLGRQIRIKPWFHPDTTFCVRSHLNDARFKNSLFLSLKLKDAIVDSAREEYGRRPSIDTENPEMLVTLQLVKGLARIFLELQGQALNIRGYRKRQVEAPIRESLAAAMLAYGGWKNEPLSDPLCGSGTIAIEAALLASNTAPGIQRKFAFETWVAFKEYAPAWQDLRNEAKQSRKQPSMRIVASDINKAAVEIAQRNAQTAGVENFIEFSVQNVFDTKGFESAGFIVCNPPYGERLDPQDMALLEFYYQLGRHLRGFDGHKLCIISLPELLKQKLHMKPTKRQATYNGPIACEIALYQLGKSERVEKKN